jgi:alpha-L-fucosidase
MAAASSCSFPFKSETPPPADRTGWFRDAKFGLFLHWGPYSLAGVEASWPIMVPKLIPRAPITEAEYTALPRRFNPVRYDPAAWVRTARQAGMRYMVITTKHHDGFCMFDAPGTDYKITRTPYGKDVIAALAAAAKEQNMRLGFYYSPPDMNHPGYRDTSKPAIVNWQGEPSRPQWKEYLDYMESHVRKLLTDYGEVSILWFDGLFEQEKYRPERFHKLIRQLSPNTLVNDRLGPDLGDYVTPEQFFPGGIPVKRTAPPPKWSLDILNQLVEAGGKPTPELMAKLAEIQKATYPTELHPTLDRFQLWETCMTMNDTWGYCPTDKNFKPADQLIRTLVEVASRGGNFLLNVGPSPEGTFPPEAEERLRRVGEWVARNEPAIRGTTYGQVQGLPTLRTTRKDGRTYLHVIDWPKGKLEIPEFPGAVSSVSLLAGRQALAFRLNGRRLTIDVPEQAPDSPISVIEVVS